MKFINELRFGWMAGITLAGLLLSTSSSLAAHATKPNVLFILADDFRPDCIAALGNAHIKTPNLDSLTERGLAFTHTYTMGSMVPAVCTPSRTMILTGRSLFHAPGQDYALWPKAMAAGGYETFHLGKKGNSFVPGMEAFQTASIPLIWARTNTMKLPARKLPIGSLNFCEPAKRKNHFSFTMPRKCRTTHA